MLPNGSRALMASRREPPDSLEWFPTPPYATRALMLDVIPHLGLAGTALDPAHCAVWEPACGEGHMYEVLLEFFGEGGWGTDVFDYGRGYRVEDFLDPNTVIGSPEDGFAPEFIITNPPFSAAVSFARLAIERAPVVALFCRTQWLEGLERYETLFRDHPPTLYAPFVERVALIKGRWEPAASTATSYAWYVWVRGMEPRSLFLIPPGRKRAHTKPTDFIRFATPQHSDLLATAIGPAAEG